MAKPELGTKRLCAGCGAKFYDLSKTPIVCPKCGTVFEVAPVVTRPRPDQAPRPAPVVPEPEVETAEPQEAEMISLEEADAEAQGKAAPVAGDAEVAEEVAADETIEDDADDTFIEEQEEEDTDVSEIIGGDIEGEEET